jgi:hypothetical protein
MTLARSARAAARLSLVAALLLGAAVPAFANETQSYTYDALGRLVKVARSGTVNSGTSECYAYDPASNRTNVTVATGANCSGGTGGVSFSIASNGPVTEGSNSAFTITKSGSTSSSLSVSYATANGTAVQPGDYTAKALTAVTFLATESSKAISVTTIDDTSVESAETFTMTLSAPTNPATITTGTATATINDNDSTPTCSGVTFSVASNAAITEGMSSVFTITKSGTASGSCDVGYVSANGTATAGSDYTATSGTHTFTSAQTSKTVSVPTTDDTAVESAETFTMSLSGPTGGAAVGTPATATATINDNDGGGTNCAGVSFSVNNAGNDEGLPVVFTVTKSGSTTSSCSLNYATADGTAVGGTGADYTIASGTLTFLSTDTTKTVSVTTRSDIAVEPDDTFYLNLSGQTGGATISDAQGLGTIYNDDVEDPCPLCRPMDAEPSRDEPLSDPPADSSEPPPLDVIQPPPPEATEQPPEGESA